MVFQYHQDLPLPLKLVEFYTNGEKWVEGLEEQVMENLAKSSRPWRLFGDAENPLLLLFARCTGFYAWLMDTVLNLGPIDGTVEALATVGEPLLCLGLLPSFYPDVWRRGNGR